MRHASEDSHPTSAAPCMNSVSERCSSLLEIERQIETYFRSKYRKKIYDFLCTERVGLKDCFKTRVDHIQATNNNLPFLDVFFKFCYCVTQYEDLRCNRDQAGRDLILFINKNIADTHRETTSTHLYLQTTEGSTSSIKSPEILSNISVLNEKAEYDLSRERHLMEYIANTLIHSNHSTSCAPILTLSHAVKIMANEPPGPYVRLLDFLQKGRIIPSTFFIECLTDAMKLYKKAQLYISRTNKELQEYIGHRNKKIQEYIGNSYDPSPHTQHALLLPLAPTNYPHNSLYPYNNMPSSSQNALRRHDLKNCYLLEPPLNVQNAIINFFLPPHQSSIRDYFFEIEIELNGVKQTRYNHLLTLGFTMAHDIQMFCQVDNIKSETRHVSPRVFKEKVNTHFNKFIRQDIHHESAFKLFQQKLYDSNINNKQAINMIVKALSTWKNFCEGVNIVNNFFTIDVNQHPGDKQTIQTLLPDTFIDNPNHMIYELKCALSKYKAACQHTAAAPSLALNPSPPGSRKRKNIPAPDVTLPAIHAQQQMKPLTVLNPNPYMPPLLPVNYPHSLYPYNNMSSSSQRPYSHPTLFTNHQPQTSLPAAMLFPASSADSTNYHPNQTSPPALAPKKELWKPYEM